jgi:EAL domain-containing protein (putative c-di-GMP-specific phosphodiesterase class I)
MKPEPRSYLNHTLWTMFQPVVSVAHMRCVGGEFLLRATNSSNVDVPPLSLFATAASRFDSVVLDELALQTHLECFTDLPGTDAWLFLNCQPETLEARADGRSVLEVAVEKFGYSPNQIVIEVLEQAAFSNVSITEAMRLHQQRGFSVAIDDFGVGSSNFDRVWGVRPDFVKLDRTLVHRASLSRSDRRVAKMLISMLHQMGAMVVAEGVETFDEALAMMDADADFLQGFYFARPARDRQPGSQNAEAMVGDLWPKLAEMVRDVGAQELAQMTLVRNMLFTAARVFQSTQSLEAAAQQLFRAPSAITFALLNSDGIQVGEAIQRDSSQPSLKLRPMGTSSGANWSRRLYFKDAIRRPGHPAVQGPRFSLLDGAFIYTMAITVELGNSTMLLAGNFRLEGSGLALGELNLGDS